ncbi:hypothetical protein IWW51_000594 [Coemansia sp. RSA 2702]|nr:hypothetical protein IWW51_000594 [Coemansia sp. RSA 2702]
MAADDTVQEVESKMERLLARYSMYDWQTMLTAASNDYCREADRLLHAYGQAMQSNATKG